MNEQGKPGEPKKVDTQPLPLKGEGKLVLGRKNEFGPVRAWVRFWEPGREATPAKQVACPVGAV